MVMLNLDSPMSITKNWYLATANGGTNDWMIVKYDHNSVADKGWVTFACEQACGP